MIVISWQSFRSEIFAGMGGLLPQYTIPKPDTEEDE